MKIGIFGDSYCEHRYVPAYNGWWQLLREHGHDVTSYGESSSSILFSAQKIIEHGDKFDFLIWAVTTPFRISIKLDQEYLHITGSNQNFGNVNVVHQNKAKAGCDYLQYLINHEEQCLTGKALVEYIRLKFPNLLTIACFPDPLNVEFNLYELCCREANTYFPGKQLHKLYEQFSDIRTCHLSIDNNKILSGLIAENLMPGTFTTNYTNFIDPKEPREFYFKSK